MSIMIHDSKSRLTSERISEVESGLNATFPPEYKKFLLKHNGGYPDPGTFSVGDSSEESHVSYFFAIHDGDSSNLLKTLKLVENRIPPNMLPIAYDDFGNLILLVVGGERAGQIFFWDHEKEYEMNENDLEAPLTKLSDSFEAFLSKLY